LLRTELIADKELRQKAESIVQKRQIFSKRLLELIEKFEDEKNFKEEEVEEFLAEAVNVFRWHKEALVDASLYSQLKNEHTLIADVISFKGPHINHLTPRCLDIDALQKRMPEMGINPKAVIEGPPAIISILLRQTSFKALTEPVLFDGVQGEHTARFGEVEQRGAALTPSGRALYDQILARVLTRCKPAADGSNRHEYMRALEEEFQDFPADFDVLVFKKLAYCSYQLTEKVNDVDPCDLPQELEALIHSGFVKTSPITYEDFLPASAAGIFQSNLGDDAKEEDLKPPSQESFEAALGMKILSEFELYQMQEDQSRTAVLDQIDLLRSKKI
jgi:uncharacterized glyoxalase superfamily metalloenzyme YdcJ